ncbi:MAG TPA: Gfo/Idh/MocA family oxidoreductase, partial [Kineosporiaceae bacterium]|nr:Gfo/Idh/MocA family oxidoreductase [Kineosporiaceae bacterium]
MTVSSQTEPGHHRHAAVDGRVRLGFIGAGGIVQRALAPAVHAADGVVLQAAAARDQHRAAALEPAGHSYADYHQLLADPTVDLVYVALDNAGHLPWTLAALAAGKHVLCEKPLGLDPAAVAAMTAAAAEHDRLLVEAFWYRWHPRTRRLEQLLTQGALGPVQQVESEFTFSGS